MLRKKALILLAAGFILFAICLAPFFAGPPPLRLLFVGNSYSIANDLPDTFAKLAESGGHRVEIASASVGGWFLSTHLNYEETLDLIGSSKWDYVVLQEQSQIPSSDQERMAKMVPAARGLAGRIRAVGATPLLFVTWAHRDGWPDNGMPSYEDMQLRINDGYAAVARELNAPMARVGHAWMEVRRQNPQVELWINDGSHPTPQGTYLAACVFYATVFRASPEGLSYTAGLSKEEALLLQKAAARAVDAASNETLASPRGFG